MMTHSGLGARDFGSRERMGRSCQRDSESRAETSDRPYADQVGKLADIGVHDTEPNIRNKISRGKFTAVFFVQCLHAIGATRLQLDSD